MLRREKEQRGDNKQEQETNVLFCFLLQFKLSSVSISSLETRGVAIN